MAETVSWMEKFEITQAHLELWREEAGPEEDLLRWCLLNGKINEAEYLEWACTAHELPVVESSWFSLPPDTDFWEKIHKKGPWKSSLFPLHEWDGLLIIACLEPIPEAQFNKPHRFVLASARALSLLWATLKHNLDITAKIGEEADTPQPETSAPQPIQETIGATLALPQDIEVPEGLAFAGTKTGLLSDFDGKMIPGLDGDTPPIGIAIETLPDMPDGLSVSTPDANEINFELAPEPIAMTRAEPKAPQSQPVSAKAIPLPPPIEREAEEIEEIVAEPPLRVPEPPTPAGAHVPPSPTHAANVAKFRDSATPKPMDIPQLDQTAPGAPRKALTNFSHCSSYEDVTDCAFAAMKDSFEKGIMLVFQGGQLKPWKWTGNVQYGGKGKPTPIDLSGASIFRVAFNTCLPYHGYVVSNPINDVFFAEFNGRKIPKHVTLMPLVIEGQIAGMLMGITDQEINYRHTLIKMEAIATDVNKALKRIRTNRVA